jgi:hypothetical protein
VTNRSNPHFTAAFAAASIAGYMRGVGEFLARALQGIYDAHMEKAHALGAHNASSGSR